MCIVFSLESLPWIAKISSNHVKPLVTRIPKPTRLSKPPGHDPADPTKEPQKEQGFSDTLAAWSQRSLSNAPRVQAKLQIGEPDDRFEQEADEFAEVARESSTPSLARSPTPKPQSAFSIAPNLAKAPEALQPKLQLTDEKETESIEEAPQSRPKLRFSGGSTGGTDAPPNLPDDIGSVRGKGSGLPTHLRRHFEELLGADLGGVRIHTGPKSASLNKQIGARAFTLGQDIFFGQGQYNPASEGGQELLAHEVAHTVQQGRGEVVRRAEVDLFEGLDRNNMDEISLRILHRRIKDKARQQLLELKFDLLAGDPKRKRSSENAQKVVAVVQDRIVRARNNPDPMIREIILAHFESILSALQNPVFADLVNSTSAEGITESLKVVDEWSDPKTIFSKETLGSITDETATLQSPEAFVLSRMIDKIYAGLQLERPIFEGETIKGDSEDASSEPNASPFPLTIDGPVEAVSGSTVVYKAKVDLSMNGAYNRWRIMGIAASVHFHCLWELRDVTEVYETARQAEAKRLHDLRMDIDGTPVVSRLVDLELKEKKIRKQSPSKEHNIGRWDVVGKQWEQIPKDVRKDYDNAKQDITDPSKSSDGSTADEVDTVAAGAGNIVTAPVELVTDGIDATLSTAGEALFGIFKNTTTAEIPFPEKEGWYLIKCVCTPSKPVSGKGHIQWASSTSSKVVHVLPLAKMAKQQYESLLDNQLSNLTELWANFDLASNEHDKETIKKQIALTETEIGGSTEAVLESRLASLKELLTSPNPPDLRLLKKEIHGLEGQIALQKKRTLKFGQGNHRLRAVFVDKATSRIVPLLLDAYVLDGQMPNPKKVVISDITTDDGSEYSGYGPDVMHAIQGALNKIAAKAEYGDGQIVVDISGLLGEEEPRVIAKDVSKRGGAKLLQRVEQTAQLLMYASALGAPKIVGMVSSGLVMAVAAERIASRLVNGTFKWNLSVVNDLLSIAGGCLSGITAIGNLRFAKVNQNFILAPSTANWEALLKIAKNVQRITEVELRLGQVGFVVGSIETLKTYIEIAEQEMAGDISPSQARLQRANLIMGAITQTKLQFFHGPEAQGTPEEEGKTTQDETLDPSKKKLDAAENGDPIPDKPETVDSTIEIELPKAWKENPSLRPGFLDALMRKLQRDGIDPTTATRILENLATNPNVDSNNFVNDLNAVMDGASPQAKKTILDLCSNPGDFLFGRTILMRLRSQGPAMELILTRFPIEQIRNLSDTLGSFSDAAGVNRLELILQKTSLTSAEVIELAIYAEEGNESSEHKIGMDRLVKLLRTEPHGALDVDAVYQKIDLANKIRDDIAAGKLALPLDPQKLQPGDSWESRFKSYIYDVLLNSDYSHQLVRQIASPELGNGLLKGKVDWTAFAEHTQALEAQIHSFIGSAVGNEMNAAQIKTLVRKVFGPARGSFFELVAAESLRNVPGCIGVSEQVGIRMAKGMGKTNADITALIKNGNKVKVFVFELKTGEGPSDRSAQINLAGLIHGNRSTLLDHIVFEGRVANQLLAQLNQLISSGMELEFVHSRIKENFK